MKQTSQWGNSLEKITLAKARWIFSFDFDLDLSLYQFLGLHNSMPLHPPRMPQHFPAFFKHGRIPPHSLAVPLIYYQEVYQGCVYGFLLSYLASCPHQGVFFDLVLCLLIKLTFKAKKREKGMFRTIDLGLEYDKPLHAHWAILQTGKHTPWLNTTWPQRSCLLARVI